MSFWDELAERERDEALRVGGQNDTAGVCVFCHLASDDVLLGVCAGCGDPDGASVRRAIDYAVAHPELRPSFF